MMKKTIMHYLQATLIRKSTKNNSKEGVQTAESVDTKQWIAPTRKAIRIKVSSGNLVRKRCTVLKESTKERDIQMSKIKCYNCGEYGHYACDCPKPHDNANIAQENE